MYAGVWKSSTPMLFMNTSLWGTRLTSALASLYFISLPSYPLPHKITIDYGSGLKTSSYSLWITVKLRDSMCT